MGLPVIITPDVFSAGAAQYANITGAPGVAAVQLAPTPGDVMRIHIAVTGSHTDAVARHMAYQILTDNGNLGFSLQESTQIAAGNPVPGNQQWPILIFRSVFVPPTYRLGIFVYAIAAPGQAILKTLWWDMPLRSRERIRL